MDMIVKNPKYFIRTTEGEFQTPFPGPNSIAMGPRLKVDRLKAIFQIFFFSLPLPTGLRRLINI